MGRLLRPPLAAQVRKDVREVRTLREGDVQGVGSVRRIDWATRLPYRLAIEVEAVESVPPARLRARSRGQLDGEGLWLLRETGDGHTEVTYVWRVQLVKRWMRALAPLLAPMFRWNHDGVMRAGEAGLRRYLHAPAPAEPAATAARCRTAPGSSSARWPARSACR